MQQSHSKLYFIGAYWTPGLFQFDLTVADVQNSYTQIAEDKFKYFRDMQLGPDGKIYISGAVAYDAATDQYTYYIPVVKCPNLPKYACNYSATEMSSAYSSGDFPDLINDHITQPKAPRVTEFSLGNDTAICFGTWKLSAPEGWQNYHWNTGEKTREITVSEPGLYYVLAGEEGFSCPTAFGSIKIKNAARQLDLGRDTILCPKTAYTLQVPDNFSHLLWNDGSTLNRRIVTKSSTYALAAQDEHGCTTRDTIVVSLRYDPRADFGMDTILCNNQSLLLQLQPTNDFLGPLATYVWQDGSTKSSYKVTQPGTYWGQVVYQGCTVGDTIRVNYVSAAAVSLGNDTSLCTGDSVLLKTTIQNADYLWSTGEKTPSITVRSNGSYWVRVNNGNCAVMDTISVSFKPKPAIFLGDDTLLCDKQQIILKPGGSGTSYTWQDGSVRNTFTVSKAGLYWAKTVVNGCSNSDSVIVSYKPLPHLNLGIDTGICVQETLLLNAADPSILSYAWQDGSTQPAYTVSKAGTYSISVAGTNGCVNKDTIVVAVQMVPDFTLGNDTTLCGQQQLPINIALQNVAYRWSTGNSTPAYIVTQPGLYWLEVSRNGCSRRDSINILYKPLPVVKLGNDTTLCEGITKTLDATNAGATYQWQDMSSAASFVVTKPGLYYAFATLNGCVNGDSIRISYKYKPRFTLGRDTTLCTGQQFVLNPSLAGTSFLWQNGSTAPSFIVQNTGTYKLTATNECGSASGEIVVEKGTCKLIMPNAFTPDNDGVNDLFHIKDPGFIKTFSMTIYNRWGGVIFRTEDPDAGWNGKYKGADQPTGNYVWYITLVTRDGNRETGKGTVLLLH